MNKSVQSITDIAPMRKEGEADPIQAEYEKGKALFERGELAQAAAALHNALLGFQEKDDQLGVANASHQIGHVCVAREEYDQALIHYNRAREICEKLQDPMSLLALSNRFIDVYRGQKQYGKAIGVCLDLLDEYGRNNDPRGTVTLLERMAEIYLDSGDVAKAADAYRTIASIHKNFRHANIADGYLQKAKDLEKAG